MRKQVLIILFICLAAGKASSQSFFSKPVFISPGVSVGYTFGAKASFGFSLDAGFIYEKSVMDHRYGLSFYQYFVYTGKHTHRLRSVSLMYQNDYLDLKVGRGRAKNPWGYSNRNRCIVHGLALELNVSFPSVYSPWVGFRHFLYNRGDWAWFNRPYNSVYIKYKYDIIQNTGLKETISLEN